MLTTKSFKKLDEMPIFITLHFQLPLKVYNILYFIAIFSPASRVGILTHWCLSRSFRDSGKQTGRWPRKFRFTCIIVAGDIKIVDDWKLLIRFNYKFRLFNSHEIIRRIIIFFLSVLFPFFMNYIGLNLSKESNGRGNERVQLNRRKNRQMNVEKKQMNVVWISSISWPARSVGKRLAFIWNERAIWI